MVIMITGGSRSGKSALAEKMCKDTGKSVGYIATAIATDDEMHDRIARHQAQRPQEWITIEQYNDFTALAKDTRFLKCEVFLLDCVTTMITNHMMDGAIDFDTCSMDDAHRLEEQIKDQVDGLLDVMRVHAKTMVIVTNEVGQGLVPSYRMGRIFRDIAGRMNVHIANNADEVYLVVAGQSLKIK